MASAGWVKKRDLPRLAQVLQRAYPKGLEGLRARRGNSGVSYSEAASAAPALEAAGYAHHLPDARGKGRRVLTGKPVSFAELGRILNGELAGFFGQEVAPRQELLEAISLKLGVNGNAAEELLSGLEAAGYTSLVYDPDHQRTRMLLKFPEAFARGL